MDFNIFENKYLSEKILAGNRISEEDALALFDTFSINQLAILASARKKIASGNFVFYNKNIHIETTNKCIYNCRFCSYRSKNNIDEYSISIDEVLSKIEAVKNDIGEVHITGGVHPNWGIDFYSDLLAKIKTKFPKLCIKAFTAVELINMCKIDNYSLENGIAKLIKNGLNSVPGGGAEILDDNIRKQICPEKPNSEMWLNTHRIIHSLGLKSNATMLYGHIERYEDRIIHMAALRKLQDNTNGFQAFIPLKFRRKNNSMSNVDEVSTIEDLKNYAVSRIFLDNIPHLKAYWPAIGINLAQMSLLFGVDDLDGTLNDSTSIYNRAGANVTPSISSTELENVIYECDLMPIERDTLYNPVK